jgi:alkyl sulfatase BDS1-like metallo-beta-lactamase superfamily hydrolase
MTDNRNNASKITIARNAAMASRLNWQDEQSFSDAQKGYIATWDPLKITDEKTGTVVWNIQPYLDFEGPPDTPPPLTVNPSLWRQAHLNNFNGLFKVCDGIYQLRAFDMSNMTVIEGKTGLIIIDPLISVQCAKSGLELYRKYRPETKKLDVTAVIYTHSHVDHFGGVEGIMPTDPKKKKKVKIYAPDGFLEHAVSENVYAGTAMGRRAQYMYGPLLRKDAKGQVDTGLGKGQSTGDVSLYQPTVVITSSDKPETISGVVVQKETIAGVKVLFHLTPGSEAPAEMDFFFPDFKAFCAAENATHNMHNIQTLRGANVRDALKWSKYLAEAIEFLGGKAEVMFASHHWPIWGRDNIHGFLGRQRDMYRYLNDQTLRMLNKGYTGIEIAEVFEMPEGLAKDWSCRGYYGSTSHNSKAVYDKYLGWFDGDPANLHKLTSEEAAPKYVALMGGAARVLKAAKNAGKKGEYRWAAELIRHVVYADEGHQEAKNLEAEMLEQMGYQAENATWRNFYLQGTQELRDGIAPAPPKKTSPTMIAAMTMSMIFDAFAAKLIGPLVRDAKIVMNWIIKDPSDSDDPKNPNVPYLVVVQDGVLNYTKNKQDKRADVTIKMRRDTLNKLMAGELPLQVALRGKMIKVTGNKAALLHFFLLLDDADPSFPIVTPRSDARAAWTGVEKLENLMKKSVEKLMDHPKIAKARDLIGELPRGC